MLNARRELAGRALPAWLGAPGRVLAQQEPAEPERELLLSDAARPFDQ
jgi:DNA-binding IclR family transcriptional regulator